MQQRKQPSQGVRAAADQAARALAACRGAFSAIVVFSLFVNLLMLAAPLFMMQVFDRVLTSRSLETLVLLTIVTAGAFAVMALLELVRNKVLIRVSTAIELALGGTTLGASVVAALRGAGHSAQGLRDLAVVRQFLTGSGALSLFDAPWTPILIAIVYLLHPVLGMVAISGTGLLLVLAVANELVMRRPLNAANAAAIAAQRKAEATVRNADVVEAMGMFGGLRARWEADNAQVLNLQVRASARSGYVTAAVKFVRMMLQISVFAVGSYLAIEQQITPGAMVAAALLMGRAIAPVEQAVGAWRGVVHARGAWQRLKTLLRAAPPREVAMALPPPQGQLSVERLLYSPPGSDSYVLKGVTFELGAGQMLGVIGPTAAGKSTLARLIVGSWQPSGGKVRLDDADVYTWDRRDFGRYVGYLPQDIELFAGNVRDNIARFGDVDPEQIVAAAQMAGVHELILHLSNGYETEIGEGGEVLSGGQRQRIALARALLGPPRLLVLDEPNANLDLEGEKALLTALAQAKEAGTTVVIISHRPSILELCDKMMVLRNGMVEMFGTRAEIMERTARPAPAPPRVAEGGVGRIARVTKLGPGAKSGESA